MQKISDLELDRLKLIASLQSSLSMTVDISTLLDLIEEVQNSRMQFAILSQREK